MFRATARWVSHINGIGAPADMRTWLSDRASLTRKLMNRSNQFRVQRLHQGTGQCQRDECATIGLQRRQFVREREVVLRCDELPVVFAHTVVPFTSSASDWPFFGMLGNRSLGTTLFGDPSVKRGALEYAKLHADHPLARRAVYAVGVENCRFPLFARRCLFRRKNGVLLVTEIFLPAIHRLQVQSLPSPQNSDDQQPRSAVNQYK